MDSPLGGFLPVLTDVQPEASSIAAGCDTCSTTRSRFMRAFCKNFLISYFFLYLPNFRVVTGVYEIRFSPEQNLYFLYFLYFSPD